MNALFSRREHRNSLVGWFIAGVLWLVMLRSLATHWAVNPQYSYGWLVPPLAAYLFFRRWTTRPAPETPAKWSKTLLYVCSVLFLPTWLLAQPNPDWRLVPWLLAVEILGITLGLLAWSGGNAWARHFAVPLGLILLAIPWPSGLESSVVGGLMQAVATVSVAALNMIGVPALQHGNLIETRAGVLGIDEACSGVRSLQATLMAAIAIGELYELRLTRRVFLLGASIAVAFVTNAARASLLGWSADRQGLGAANRWHDPAGFAVMTICFLLVWGIAVLLRRDTYGSVESATSSSGNPLPGRIAVGLLIWFGLVFLGTEIWFQTGKLPPASPRWNFRWPVGRDAHEIAIAEQASAMLRYDDGRGMTWTDPVGGRWVAYHFQWDAGPARSRILARMHRPEYCLPSTGWNLAEDRGTVAVDVDEETLPFRRLRFTQGESSVHVWFCTVQDRAPGSPVIAESDSARWSSVQAVLRRERSLGQQVLEIALLSSVDSATADAEFQQEIAPRIQRTVPK